MGNNCTHCKRESSPLGVQHGVNITHCANPYDGKPLNEVAQETLDSSRALSPQERSACDEQILDTKVLSEPNKPHVQRLAGGLTVFALKLYRQLVSTDSDDANIFVSPFCISVGMAMAYLGARGNTRKQMKSRLGFEDMEDEVVHESMLAIVSSLKDTGCEYMIQMANRLYCEKSYSILDEYLRLSTKYYGTTVEAVDFR